MQHKLPQRRITMPPKARYTRDEIIEIALELVSAKGTEALNARNLAAALGTSTRPVFTAFKNMNELITEVKAAAMRKFDSYAEMDKKDSPAFKNVGMQMILFATEQPKLFQMLFMSENKELMSFNDLFDHLGNTSSLCTEYIQRDYGLDSRETMLLFRSMWLYTFSIGGLIARGVCRYNKEEVSEMLSIEFRAVIGLILSGKAFDKPEEFQKNTTPEEFQKQFKLKE